MNNITRHIIRRLAIIIVAMTALTPASLGATYGVADIPNPQISDSTCFLSDPDGYIDAATAAHINSRLLDIRRKTTAEVAVVIVGSINPSDMNRFASDLFDKWGLGKKDADNGLLLIAAINDRKYSFRTGRGTEVVLTDAKLGRIGRQFIDPAFRKKEYARGISETVDKLHTIMTDPAVRDDLAAGKKTSETDWSDILFAYMWFCLALTAVLTLWILISLRSARGKSDYEKYMKLQSAPAILLGCSAFALGMPLLIYFPVRSMLRRWRDGRHDCPNCGESMVKLDEDIDNSYLTPAQDAEERFNSVDYDVWLCPECGETDVYPYYNRRSSLKTCPVCHARTLRHSMDRVLVQPTQSHDGKGVHVYNCLNCGHTARIPYVIAKTAAPGIFIIPGGFGGRGGGGGFGGGFGGGSTGGGGYNGSW